MTEGLGFVAIFVLVALVYSIVGHIGNKIVDVGSDTLSNAYKRKKNEKEYEGSQENLADRYHE